MLDNLKVGVLAPLSMFTQLPAMIAPERNYRRLGKSELLQHVEHPGESFVLSCFVGTELRSCHLPISSST